MTFFTDGEYQWRHDRYLSQNICGRDWNEVLERLAVIEADLPGQLTQASQRLHTADCIAASMLWISRAVLEATDNPSDERRFQQTDAEEMFAIHGYLHPSRTRLLTDAAHRAMADRHEAREALAHLLLNARLVLDQTAC